MYGWSFYDPDGHHWEVVWMDPDANPHAQPSVSALARAHLARDPRLRGRPRADRARRAGRGRARAVRAAEQDDLEVHLPPVLGRERAPSGRARPSRRSCARERPQRPASRWMCVSTGNAGTPNACTITTLAVLWPTPGSASSCVDVGGHAPAVLVAQDLPTAPWIAFAFAGARPHERIMRSISASGSSAIACGRRRAREQRGRHLVHALVGALRGEHAPRRAACTDRRGRAGSAASGCSRSRIRAIRRAFSARVTRPAAARSPPRRAP